MQLPIDVRALVNEMTDIKAARATELSVSVYMDNDAEPGLVAHVRNAFASTLPTVRLSLSYLDNRFAPYAQDDFAVIVAGSSRGIGAAAAALRAAGVPVMIVTASPSFVARTAEELGYAIPDGDIVAPPAGEGAEEPLEFSDDFAIELNTRIGRWIVAVCHEKKLAMAIAFPFMRRALAKDSVQATSLQNAGIGLVPLIPGADLPILTLNQAKMVLQIAAAYGHAMDKGRVKELAAVVGGAYLFRVVARELLELVPALGFIIRPGIAYGGTAAVGNAAIEYFEGGEDAAGVANIVSRAKETGSNFVSRVRAEGPSALPGVWDKVQGLGEYIPVVQGKIKEYAPKVVDVVDDLMGSVVAQSNSSK